MVAVPFAFDRDTTAEGFQTPRDIYSFESIFGPKGPNMQLTPQTQEEIDAYNNNRKRLLQEGILQPGDVPELDPTTKFDVPEDTETSKKIDEFFGKYVMPVLDKVVLPIVAPPIAMVRGATRAIDWVGRQMQTPPVDNRSNRPGDESWGSGGYGSDPGGNDAQFGPDVTGGNGIPEVTETPIGEDGQPTGPSVTTGGPGAGGSSMGTYSPPSSNTNYSDEPGGDPFMAEGGKVVGQSPRDFMAELDAYRQQIAENPALKETLLAEVLKGLPNKAKDKFSLLIENYLNEGISEEEAGGDWTENNVPQVEGDVEEVDRGGELEAPATGRTKVMNPEEFNPAFERDDVAPQQVAMAQGGNVKRPQPKMGMTKKTTVVLDDKGKPQSVQKDVSKGDNKVSEIIKRAPPKKPGAMGSKKPLGSAPKKMAEGGTVPMPSMVADPSAAPPEAMADDVPMKANEGDFIINMDAVKSAGIMDIKKMINTALEEAAMDGKTIVPPNAEGGHQGNPVDIFVHNGEVHIPKELLEYIGEDKLEKLNNRGLKKRAQREEANKQQQATQMLPQNIANYAPKGYAEGGEVTTPFPKRVPTVTSNQSSKGPRGFYLRRKSRQAT